jgi:hypothetical protein
MHKKLVARTLVMAVVFAAFATGYFCGSVSERSAHAQGIGGVLEQAAKGANLGAVSDLGSSIVDMEKNVSGLQKNLETLKKVQSLLTGK